ncbi:MAG TPA: SH3 domain-containing protein [Zeimonas sp.]
MGPIARTGPARRAAGVGPRSGSFASFAAAAAALFLGLAAGVVSAAEFREVTSAAGVLYDGPSEHARKLFLVPRGTPLEVVSSVAGWAKVRDLSGDVLWIERGALGEPRHVVANTLAAVRRAPQGNAELVVQVERGVLLEVVGGEAPTGWVHVRHRDGPTGYVQSVEVWGR